MAYIVLENNYSFYGILMYFILIYRLAMLARLMFCPKFINLVD